MNVSITDACNRRCDYCFQRDWYLSKGVSASDETATNMSLDTFKDIVHWVCKAKNVERQISLMGGEPTLHPDIIEMIEYCMSWNMNTTLISNISCEPEKFKKILSSVCSCNSCECGCNGHFGMLVNSDYPKAHRSLFLTNFKELCHSPIDFSISTTLLANQEETVKAADRIAELLDIYEACRPGQPARIRIAPYCPNQHRMNEYKFYNFGPDILLFTDIVRANRNIIVSIGMDCSINGCEIDRRSMMQMRAAAIDMKGQACGTGSPFAAGAFDVMVDGSIIWCSSADFLKLKDWRDYSSIDEASMAMHRQWEAYWGHSHIKCDITNCGQLSPIGCPGVCVAKNAWIENMIEAGETRQKIHTIWLEEA